MIRVIVQVADAAMAANVGGPVQTWFKSFDIDAPELEKFLRTADSPYREKHVAGVELLEVTPNTCSAATLSLITQPNTGPADKNPE